MRSARCIGADRPDSAHANRRTHQNRRGRARPRESSKGTPAPSALTRVALSSRGDSAWRRVLRHAGLSIRFHDLWDTCIYKLAEGPASEETLMTIAGHLSREMIEHYSHIRMAAKRTA